MNVIFIDRLKYLMNDKQQSQKQLANGIEITQQAISRYLKGERTPDIDTLANICKFFEVSADYLLGLEDEFGNKTY